MEGSIPAVPADRLVPQSRPRDAARDRERGKPAREFTLTPEARPEPAPEAEQAPQVAHSPNEEGVGRRIDVTA